MKKKTLCIDFDGTICQKQSYGNGAITSKPNDNAAKVIQQLADEYEIVIFTTRANDEVKGDVNKKIETVRNWLIFHQIPFSRITCKKPVAIAYIDDRGIRFTNWNDMANYFLQ